MAGKKQTTGLDKNTASALAYVLGPITGVIFLLIESNPKVRFHAMQSIVVFVVLMLLGWIMPFTIILLPLAFLMPLVMIGMWILLIFRAWRGDDWEVPLAGAWAKKLLKMV